MLNEGEESKSPIKESDSGGIRRNTGEKQRVRNMWKRKRGPSYRAR